MILVVGGAGYIRSHTNKLLYQKGDPAKLIGDATKAKKVLGWNQKFFDLESILQTAWEWHKCIIN